MKLNFYKLALFVFAVSLFSNIGASAQNIDIHGPVGSELFGTLIAALPNGNVVVLDPYFDAGATTNVGAVYLYNGMSGALISTMTGTTANDSLGYNGVTVLSDGNFVISSYAWDNGAIVDAGAVTWCSKTTGCPSTVTLANSLVGSSAGDSVGSYITPLNNGNYVVGSSFWDNGAVENAGAVTFINSAVSTSGAVSTTNSLYGGSANSAIGIQGTYRLPNGNYVVCSPNWSNGVLTSVGAITFGNGTTGITGEVSTSNSLTGLSMFDHIGGDGITVLTNGNYVAINSEWDGPGIVNAGAITLASGTTGVSGFINSSNSLVGASDYDRIGNRGVTALSNGNYVVSSANWSNSAVLNVGAVTFGNGTTGIVGAVGISNSLIGSTDGDSVGGDGVVALSNGNYIVRSSDWFNGAISRAGAATFGNGTTGITGEVSSLNSLVGTAVDDRISGSGVTALSNGNYVVSSSSWDNGAIPNVGAATFANGMTGIVGAVTAANSLIGAAENDFVGSDAAIALTNGNYVVSSPHWDNAGIESAGAATFCNGTTGTIGTVSNANSLVGSAINDAVGNFGINALTNGNYIVRSPYWNNGAINDVGAVTIGSGTTGKVGTISATNSLIGSTTNDQVGVRAMVINNGNYVIHNSAWSNGAAVSAGAVTFGNGSNGIRGVVNSGNSVLGTILNSGYLMQIAFDPMNSQIVVSRPREQIVTLFRPMNTTAANVSISGTVLSGKNAVVRANVSLTDSSGNTRTVKTNSFGNYRFDGISAGETVTVQVSAKGYNFAPQIVTLNEDLADFNLNASE